MGRAAAHKTMKLNMARGVDNRSHEAKLRPGFVRDANNVDIYPDGAVTRRKMPALASALDGAHSLWAHPQWPTMLVADVAALYSVDAAGTTQEIVSGLSGAPVSYVYVAGRVFWSNGERTGCMRNGGAPVSWGVETPGMFGIHVASAGGMYAGRYGVTMTFVDRYGEESGAPEPLFISVPEGGGITVLPLPVPKASDVVALRVYCTSTNGDVFMRAADVAIGNGQVNLTAGPLGEPLSTSFLSPFPAATQLLQKAGRIFGARDTRLVWSEPLYYGLSNLAADFYPFPAPLTMVAAPTSRAFVMYVGTPHAVYRLAGETVDSAALSEVLSVGAQPGTLAMVAADKLGVDGATGAVPLWVGSDGIVYMGSEAGPELLHKRFLYPAMHGAAAAFAPGEDLDRYIVTGRGRKNAGAAAFDSAEIIVHDDTRAVQR